MESKHSFKARMQAWWWEVKQNSKGISIVNDQIYAPKIEHQRTSSQQACDIVDKLFQQESALYNMVAHKAGCDIFSCGPRGCWEFVPDKIIKTEIISPEQMKDDIVHNCAQIKPTEESFPDICYKLKKEKD